MLRVNILIILILLNLIRSLNNHRIFLFRLRLVLLRQFSRFYNILKVLIAQFLRIHHLLKVLITLIRLVILSKSQHRRHFLHFILCLINIFELLLIAYVLKLRLSHHILLLVPILLLLWLFWHCDLL